MANFMKTHKICPATGLTWCGYRFSEVLTEDAEHPKANCKTCERRERFNMPVKKPKWD